MFQRGLEGAARGLQVLSKKEWKVLRNKYLNMQRKHMKALKQVLRTQHTLPGNRGPLPTTVYPGILNIKSKINYINSSKIVSPQFILYFYSIADSSQGVDDQESKPEATATAEIPFVEGVIVTAHLTEPCVNVKELKQSTKANVHVKYVDIKEGSTDIYIRMDDTEAAKQVRNVVHVNAYCVFTHCIDCHVCFTVCIIGDIHRGSGSSRGRREIVLGGVETSTNGTIVEQTDNERT